MAYGIQSTLISTGSIDNVKIVRKAANGEISSIIDGETQNVIRSLPHIAETTEGKQNIECYHCNSDTEYREKCPQFMPQ